MTGPGDDPIPRLRLEKQALRKRILDARAAIAPEERERLSRLITERILALPEVQRARCMLAYLSFGEELSTAHLIAGLRDRRLVLPRIDRAAHRLDLYRVEDAATDTAPGVWGIREPDPDRCARADLSEIDLIVVPGVAFTAACARLGYGGGYYDELLSRWEHPPFRVAPAFDVQLVQAVPLTQTDLPVDAVITQSALHRRA
jgi:5-formyltetrahydrofolate cyclo-ligase